MAKTGRSPPDWGTWLKPFGSASYRSRKLLLELCGLMSRRGSLGSGMRFLRSISIVLCGVSLLAASFASNPSTGAKLSQAAAILPPQFAGWQMQGTAQTSTDAAAADPTNSAILKEYRFSDFASSIYTREDGRTLKIRAARFADASGAFGAYTFYLQPQMTAENTKKEDKIGDQA